VEDRVDFDIDKISINSSCLNKVAGEYSSLDYFLNLGLYPINKRFDPYRMDGIINKRYYKTNKRERI
jgi:hypothetical protein